MANRICSVADCDKAHYAHSFCKRHHYRWQNYGDPLFLPSRKKPAEPRFWAKVDKADDGGCWLWIGGKTGSGYGAFAPVDRRTISAHRYSYELHFGPIPDGLEIDHVCRVRHCVNPAHLEAVTHAENMRRADVALGVRSAATECPSGHPYDEQNTEHRNGRRHCRSCQLERNRR